MQKLTTKIIDANGDEKEIFVFVDNRTANVLLPYQGTDIYHQYVLDEYKMQWGDYWASRRGVSLEEAVEEKGFDVQDESDIESEVVRSVYCDQIRNAIKALNEEQQFIVKRLFYDEKRAADVAKELHISRSAMSQRIGVIFDRLKIILKNFNDEP